MFMELYLATFVISIGLALVVILKSINTDASSLNDTVIAPEFDYNSDSDPGYTNQNYYRNRVFDSDNDSLM